MPNTSGSAKKNVSGEGTKAISPQSSKNKSNSSSHNKSGELSAGSASSKSSTKARKRKRREVPISSDSELESELEECNLDDAIALERNLRKVAKTNSLNDDEMKKLLQKFVKNEHVLALVTLKAEDELARERQEMEKHTYAITDTPSVPKLTRAKARELNKTPAITLPALNEPPQPEIAALIKEDLHSDEDDEEYIFKEEDFVSDDDPNTTTSDFDSNPCTPQTPHTQIDYEDSPVKLTSDGCFKIPMDKREQTQESMRIAARTRSKFCLQQTTIEDIQSEFVPPDVDLNDNHDTDTTANDEDWMQFLNDFSKPLSNSLLGDDDDPVNDPEYIAADKEKEDAEELRDVNISKKELTELVAELFEGLVNEGISLESVDLETPQKFLESSLQLQVDKQITPTTTPTCSRLGEVTRQINFQAHEPNAASQQTCVSDATISSTNITQTEYSFQPYVMSTPSFENRTNTTNSTLIPVAVTTKDDTNSKTISIPQATSAPELIAIPVPGHPNQFHLARVLATQDTSENVNELVLKSPENIEEDTQRQDNRYSVPYDNNFTWQYISVRRHVYTEYMEKFENLRNMQVVSSNSTENTNEKGFKRHQHDILQQQLRIHVQMLTQTYLQTYSHPEFWKMAPQVRLMLDELNEKSSTHATFNAWNLKGAIDLINRWEQELAQDTLENKEMMAFLHKEIELTNRNTRQIPRFAPRIMDFILESNVFMYPAYLPRIPFTPKVVSYHMFSPSESLLIALGLDKHMQRIKGSNRNISKKMEPLVLACKYMHKDTVFGKTKRRIWDQVKKLRKASYYNPVKYYFEHNCAPPIEHQLVTFENNTVLPPIQCANDLPLAWQNYVKKKTQPEEVSKKPKNSCTTRKPSKNSDSSFLDIVREAVGENVQLPDCLLDQSQASNSTCDPNNATKKGKTVAKRAAKSNNITINVNYVFGVGTNPNNDVTSLINTTTCTPPRGNTTQSSEINHTSPSTNIVAYNYDFNLQQLQPVVATSNIIESNDSDNNIPNSVIEHTTPAKKLKRSKLQSRKRVRKNWLHKFHHIRRFGISRKRNIGFLFRRRRRAVKKRIFELLSSYRNKLQLQELSYSSSSLVLRYYKYFRALELYTEFLDDLKMFCRNAAQPPSNSSTSTNKRARTDDDTCPTTTTRSRKVSRQEENLRNMLLPDSAEDANRKDGIYAFNFYEKVEEIFKTSNRADDYEKFNSILKSFNPKTDRAADLYYKLESLFLPDYPELAQVFLTFLLPSEAAEIGKFFEHFMITNMTTFINKLNVYFNKQPAQIRKIYNCLSELAEDTDVTIKKVEEKILPLLKGNQFLVDWFMQQFPEAPVPERFLPTPEHVNLKEVQNNHSGEFIETIKDMMGSPTSDQQPPCQLRYINGRIFYGLKMTLPAKLSFMAKKYTSKEENVPGTASLNFSGCLHGIKEYGEQRLSAAVATSSNQPNNTNTNVIASHNDGISNDTTDKSEEDELSKALIIDTTVTGSEEDSCSSIEACDDATLRSHALRLNPSYYGNPCFTTVNAASTPNMGNSYQAHYPNSKKHSLYFYEDIKMSPRKNAANSLGISTLAQESKTLLGEKRRSPTKKIRSPNNTTKVRASVHQQQQQQPMVVIHHEHNSGPIIYAKKLKTLIESSDEQTTPHAEQQSDKLNSPIIARVKQRLPIIDQISRISKADSDDNSNFVGKYENSDDLEFLPEHTPPHKKGAHQKMGFPRLELNADSSTEECSSSEPHKQASSYSKVESDNVDQQKSFGTYNIDVVSSTNVDSDEDCKLDIVATLATTANEHENDNNSTSTTTKNMAQFPLPIATNAFTRDEDKIILIEMKLGSSDRNNLLERISTKLPNRTVDEISTRHQFLMDFLSKLQGKQ